MRTHFDQVGGNVGTLNFALFSKVTFMFRLDGLGKNVPMRGSHVYKGLEV